MIEIDESVLGQDDLVAPIVIAAFEGWNDAADSASGVIDHLMKVWDARVIAEIDPEEYYDFQVNRPHVGNNAEGMRQISWPGTRIAVASPTGMSRDVILIRGLEPSMRWRQFCHELLVLLEALDTSLVVTLGALLADAPHTRPIQVSGNSTEPELVDRLRLEVSTYEGPTGIVGVFGEACVANDLATLSFWAAVPHYVAAPPCPQATLALIHRVEELLGMPIPLGTLPEDALAWVSGVGELAEDDPDIADYVRSLEETRDTTELPEASGEAIAREFEKFLKRREDEA